ncbi:cytochrome P450 [Lasiosphaeris hirsuta]|uniref:Cytochrome P450 n=1 Tax=Lasiosphaeris hirsuta TaxID=260670 RepID=A0AA40DWJ6_9PEZI|nr:cytochrome P450 [Lasiosphaeris hirsuta]
MLDILFSPSAIVAIAAAVLSSGIIYFIRRLNAQRRFLADNDLPKPPHDWLWGHAKLVGEYGNKITGDYMQAAWTQMKYDFKLPEVYYLDMWPFAPDFIMCTGPDAAALVTQTNAFPQGEVVADFFGRSIGRTFIEATNGPLWKELHQMLAPGLTPSATKTYHDLILDEARRLYDRVHRLAASEQVVDMGVELGRYPFSVVWRVLFGEKVERAELYDMTKRLSDISQAVQRTMNPIALYREKRERAAIVKRLEAEIGKVTRARFSELKKARKTLPTRTTATCLLDRMLLDRVRDGKPLDDRLRQLVYENAKGMLVAGYGTTTDTSSYVLMLLSVFPEALQKLREEHDRVFPSDIDGTLRVLRSDPSITKDLAYTTAVIQEALRMFPIGMVVRAPPPGMTSFKLNGKTYPVKPNHYFGVMAYSMHYDPDVFESPASFRPERFLDEEPAFPRNAYRPFERGLRSCIGQNLAMDEMRIALVMLARCFDFELRGHNPVKVPRLAHTDMDTKIGDHAFQKSRFSAGPNDETMMKVMLAKR